jgi:uracil-DNA glycosylase
MSQLGVERWSFINASYADIATFDSVNWEVLELARGYSKIVALGQFASAALTRISISHFQLPHPSPLNRKLNDPTYEKTVLRQCYNYLHEN